GIPSGCLPLGSDVVKQRGEVDRFAEVDRHLAIALTQRAECTEQSEQRFLFFWFARKLTNIRFAFHQLFVADVDRLKHYRAARLAQEAAHGHREHSTARAEQAAGARTSTFDEIFERYAAHEKLAHVFGKDRRI